MRFVLDGLTVFFPYDYLYPEQYEYMKELKRALDAKGHAALEMPTGTGKTITLLSLITSYQLAHPDVGKLIYATRTVPEMEKVLAELKGLQKYREKCLREDSAAGDEASAVAASSGEYERGSILALGLSSRKNMCIHPAAIEGADRESVDSMCRKMTASWVRSEAVDAAHGTAAAAPMATDDAELQQVRDAAAAAAPVAEPNERAAEQPPPVPDIEDFNVGNAPPGTARLCSFYERLENDYARPVIATADNGSNGTAAAGAATTTTTANDDGSGNPTPQQVPKLAASSLLPPGVYTLEDLREYGKKKGLCPYFLARRAMTYANVVVYNYQYLIDPKVSAMVSRELERECVVVFDEAHNIDNVCIEALSVNLRSHTLDVAGRNLVKLGERVEKAKQTDASRLQEEYSRLVSGLVNSGTLGGDGAGTGAGAGGGDGGAGGFLAAGTELELLQSPVLPADVLSEAIPGNIRRAEHFLAFLRRLLEYLKTRLNGAKTVESESTVTFLESLHKASGIDSKSLRFCYDRLSSLMRTLEITEMDEFYGVQLIADLATLVGTYKVGFAVIIEPFDARLPAVPDPILQLCCLDASLAIHPVLERFRSVIITSGTLSPLDLYPKLLRFRPVALRALPMTLTRECLRPVVVTRGADLTTLSTRFEDRGDDNVATNYGKLLVALAKTVPDGLVCFFVSYSYMDRIVSLWDREGVLQQLSQHKLVFVETTDVVETTLALDNYRRACDCGRGAVFLSIARGKVSEGIDFDRHYGRCVVMMGVPYQYTLSRVLRARLEYLRETFAIREDDYLSFDALRQAAQCVGRVIRSKNDYGLMVFADCRYNRSDKRNKLPGWISSQLRDAHLNLSVDMCSHVAREYMKKLATVPLDEMEMRKHLLSESALAQRGRLASSSSGKEDDGTAVVLP